MGLQIGHILTSAWMANPFESARDFLWAHVDLSSYLKHCSASQGLGSRTGNRHQQL